MMKKLFSYIILLLTLTLIGCEDVVNVDLANAAPKIVIDASIKWQKGTTGNEQTIRITTTGDYYQNTVPVVNGAIVTVADSNGNIFNFNEVLGTGNYVCTNFNPIVNETYTLTVVANGTTYTASDKLYAVPEITTISQRNDAGLTGNDIELKFNFQDNSTEENYYLEQYQVPFKPFPLYGVLNDEFTNGNNMFSLIFDEDFESGQNIQFSLHGISKRYYNYMNILINVAGGSSNGPFATPPATVRGNISNQTNPDDYPLGYFRLSEIDVRNYTIQ
ncbi:DUF4249 domain-containing protein [Flavobacterium sp.]|jgi:hypothetical protein|uniref:DUF4249 domain-containing protein n=1 Tax=Flavobacterium sp. TaxID=239 RepID=UPI0037BFB268